MANLLMIDLKDFTLEEMEEFLRKLGQPAYRARQLMKWIYHKKVRDFSLMTDLPRAFQQQLLGQAFVSELKPALVQQSRDSTVKYLFRIADGCQVESVFIPEERRRTACLSVQVGCPLGCKFCLTGKMGYRRDLTTAEMVNQLLALQDNGLITNVVFMGMGEPLLNFDNIMKAISIFTDPLGLGLAARRITISTVGIPAKIAQLAAKAKVNLAVSLHATTEEVRRMLMPVSAKYPLSAVLKACRDYPVPERRRITFEYLLIAGINDTPEDAFRLVRLLKGIKCKVNLIPYNEFPGSPFKRPTEEAVASFQEILVRNHLTAIIRASRGNDILAACGQLGASCQEGIWKRG